MKQGAKRNGYDIAGPGWIPARSSARRGATLLLSLTVLLGFGVHAYGQQHQLAPKTVSIDASTLLKRPLQYRFAEEKPQPQTELQFWGNGEWRFIKFDQLPAQTTLKVNGQRSGYQNWEELQPNKWYAFRNYLPVVLEIKPDANMPVEIAFSFGAPAFQAGQEFLKAPNWKAEEVRKFSDHNEIKPDTPKQSLQFFWDVPVSNTTSAAATPSPMSPSTSGVSWVTYLTHEDPLIGIIVLVGTLIAIVGLVGFGWRLITAFIERSKPPRRADRKPDRPSPLESFLSETAKPKDNGRVAPSQTVRVKRLPISRIALYDKPRLSEEPPTPAATERSMQPGDIAFPTPRAPVAVKAPAEIASSNENGQRLKQMTSEEISQLRMMLKQKADRPAQVDMTSAMKDLENKLTQADRKVTMVTQQLEMLVLDQASLMEDTRTNLTERVTEIDRRGAQVQHQLGALLQEMGELEARLQSRFSEVQTVLDRQTVPDSFYAKILGAVVGENIEALQEGNFERLVGDRLNQFFQTGIARGEALQDLRVRAEGVSSALRDVNVQMTRLNPEAAAEARHCLQRIEEMVTELSGLQAQLQSRRATVEATLRFPVSMYAGARQTFLDELGRGIKREINKLDNPESYFAGELEQLITTDLIAVVDICDRKIAHPGSQPELESLLARLFEQSGLRAIMPHQGDPFRAAEQDLIQKVGGDHAKSLTVAQVVTRGFYYKHGDNETLLRKAGVTIFR